MSGDLPAMVTAIIPTTGRVELLRAVESAMKQTVPIEILVVLDRPERETDVRRLLKSLRYRMIVTEGRTGGGSVRNLGVRESAGEVVAFLDDDDEWLPDKTAKQLKLLKDAPATLVSCRSFLVGRSERVVPTSVYSSEEHISSYLMKRTSLKLQRNFIQTSGLLMQRKTALQVPWRPSLPRHQDWAFVIDQYEAGTSILTHPEPLVRVYQGSVNSVSRSNAWAASMQWLEEFGSKADRRSRGDFIASIALRSALRDRQWLASKRLLGRAISSRARATSVAVGFSGLLGK